jgi:hypothetical protein
MGYSYWKRNTVQVDASVSSLAGVGTLMDDGIYDPVNDVVIYATVDPDGDGVPNDPDGAVVFSESLLYAEKNIPNEDILAAIDLHAGNWEPTNRIFTSAGTWDPSTLDFDSTQPQEFDAIAGAWTNAAGPVVPLNAVLAETRRAAGDPSNNPLPLFLAAAVGLPEVNINTVAIATVGARAPIGFDGCLMALNPDEPDTFKAFGTADISAYDCDIYVNSNDECALAGNGVPVIEVGDELNPGMIYVVGESCATNEGVEWNCNLSAEAVAAGGTCPETNLSYEERQIDPFAYTYNNAIMAQSGMSSLQDLQCGKQYISDGSTFTDGSNLADYYAASLGDSYDPGKHSGIGEFIVDAYAQSELFGDVATAACTPAGGNVAE